LYKNLKYDTSNKRLGLIFLDFVRFFTSNGVCKCLGYEIYFFFDFFEPQTVKNDQICIQTAEFVFKRPNLDLNGLISRRHLTAAHWLQWWAVVRAVPPDPAPTRAVPSALARQ
jgi:hypothetical protein